MDERRIVFHFGMTGGLSWSDGDDERGRFDRVVVHLGGKVPGELRYRSLRKLGGIWLARDEDEVAAITGPLGPDAASLDRDEFVERLAGRRGGVKAALMDQSLLAYPTRSRPTT